MDFFIYLPCNIQIYRPMKRRFLLLMLTVLACGAVNAQSAFVHPWMNKKVAYFGDSITDPRNSGSKLKYWHFLQEWLNITPYVYGISGRQWNDIPNQTDKLLAEHADSVDAILIFIGTNDFNEGVPIGEWYDIKEKEVMAGIHETKHLVTRKRMLPVMSKDTYKGRINIALDKLKRTYPTKQIVLLTPIHRAGFYANDKNWQPTEDYYNRCGEPLQRYVDAVKEAGNVWAVPVIDLNALSGLFPMADEHVQYFKDGAVDRLHPNDKGHERMARTLYYQLSTLPCTF